MTKRRIVPERSGPQRRAPRPPRAAGAHAGEGDPAPPGVPAPGAEGPHPLHGATFDTGAAALAQLPPPGPPEIAFAGRSNAGKSSAINAIANRTRLAFASRTPGRTQQINFFALRNSPARVADLPGYGYAAVSRALKQSWQRFLWQYVTGRPTLVALVLVADARHGLKALDLELLAAFLPSGRPVLVLSTKSDKLSRTAAREAARAIERQVAEVFPMQAAQVRVIPFSATERTGVTDAEATIASWIG